MCLVLDDENNKAKIAESDITCYKILKLSPNSLTNRGDVGLKTYFQNANVKIGCEYESDLFSLSKGLIKTVEQGLHSFVYQGDIWHYLGNYELSTVDHDMIFDDLTLPKGTQVIDGFKVIVECVIPKGSRYFKGYFGVYSFPSYASDKLRYVKIYKL